MERKINMIFGILGGFILLYINKPPLSLYTALGSLRGYAIDFIFPLISFTGFILIYYFCIILLIDVLRSVIKK